MKEFILSNIDEFNTSEAYYGNPVIEENYITIPYFNMGLTEDHPLNFSKEQLFIDYSYLHIIEPKYISVYKRGVIKNELKGDYNQDYSRWFIGLFMGDETILDAEMEIQASDVYLIIPKEYRISTEMWIPNFKQFKGKGNLIEEHVMKFLSKTPKLKKVIINFS
ncbi:hypothetical protein [Winogradskyella sp.]|uniref:hypothetical protein n=1 Tax=Winogradskyella sp. TaxID=1883156 RepID=UPI003AB19EF5